MPRYIDAELIDSPEMQRKLILCDDHELTKDLALFPTADVQEVRHARFVGLIIKGDRYDRYQAHSCSLCAAAMRGTENYCPNCGAKMDGKESEDGRTDTD